MERKYQIFVSSTFRDLVDERQDAIRNILDMKHIPAGMELFPASDTEQLSYIKRVIDQCDYYMLIMGGRYGSIDSDGISYTEREYDYAVENGKTVIAFVHDNTEMIPLRDSETNPHIISNLENFRSKVMAGRLINTWSTRENLEPKVIKSLMHAFNDHPQVGWIRGDMAASDDLLKKNNDLLQENADLRKKIDKATPQKRVEIPNLSGLDDEVLVIYERYDTYFRDYKEKSITLTWGELAVGVASALDVPHTAYILLDAFKFCLNRRRFDSDSIKLNDVERHKIKVQMEALGIITVEISQNTKGTLSEFLKLTKFGRDYYIASIAARKDIAE